MTIRISPEKSEEDLKILVKRLDKEISTDLDRFNQKYSKKCDIDGEISDLRNISRKIGAAEAVLDIMAHRLKGTDFVLSEREVLREKDRRLTETIKKAASTCGYEGRVYREKGGKAKLVYGGRKKK